MRNLLITRGKFPLILLGICIVSFGLLIPKLGFYFDDWPVIYVIENEGLDAFWDFYQYDRPFSAWTFILTAPILGAKPIYWHIFTLIMRWLSVWGMWSVLRNLWPNHPMPVNWMAIFFAIYPTFFQQSTAVAYSQHFITYSFFFVSILFMIKAIKGEKYFWPLTILGMITAAIHMFTMEYLVGLELIRPVILWLMIHRMVENKLEGIRSTLKNWMPYVLVWIIFIFWRLFIISIPEDPNPPQLLYALQEEPLIAILDLIQNIVRDFLYLFVSAWSQTFQPELVDYQYRFGLFAWGIVLLSTISLAFIMKRLRVDEQFDDKSSWNRQALFLGAYATFVGLLPVWFAGRQILVGKYSDRFTLPAMLGASIFMVALIHTLITNRVYRLIILSAMVGLSVGVHLRTSNDYRWDWINQTRYYWQLQWRAPGVEQYTPIVVNRALSNYVSRYVASLAINTLYPQDGDSELLSYWFFEAYYTGEAANTRSFVNGKGMRDSIRGLVFEGDSRNSLIIYNGFDSQCMWFLTPKDIQNREIEIEMRQLAAGANLERIITDLGDSVVPPMQIFGPEAAHTWCYYYQKADQARQLGDWGRVLELEQEARQSGYWTTYGYEHIVFIEAHAALGNWQQAIDLSIRAYQKTGNKIQSMLCATWEGFQSETEMTSEYQNAFAEVNEQVGCETFN